MYTLYIDIHCVEPVKLIIKHQMMMCVCII